MTITETYLNFLQGKIFKLLPMREDYDSGVDNHLKEYMENLCANLEGALGCYSELNSFREVAEIQGNLWSLREDLGIEFSKWRSTILRSTRLIQNILTREYGEV